MSKVRKNSDVPVIVVLNKIKRIPLNVQNNVEILFIIKGEIKIIVNKREFKLKESDVVFINNGDVYEVYGKEENLVLSMQIENNFFDDVLKGSRNLFLCNSALKENEHYKDIRKILAQMLYEYSNREYGYNFKVMSLLYNLIYLLKVNFAISEDFEVKALKIKNSKYTERINNIISYIKRNYHEQVSLQDVADSQYLTPEYLSKFFKTHTGMTFSKYLNEFRLSQAVKELIRTSESVTKVAMNNGFPNMVAFNKIFREIYGTTPAEYRNKVRKKSLKIQENKKEEAQVTKVDYDYALEKLSKYVMHEKINDEQLFKCSSEKKLFVSANVVETKKLTHSWRNLINLGYAEDGLRSDLQQHLIHIQDKVKFKYVRFQGIFSDEMLNYGYKREDERNYNFAKIDRLIDFLYSINLKPFIELADKAKLLNKSFDKIMYFKNLSQRGKSLEESVDLLEKFIVHCVNRYGINEVEQWYFELWKEGDIDYVFWDGNFEEYLNRFQSYYKVINKIVPNAKMGGPSFNPEINMKQFNKFLSQLKETNTRLDFLSVSIYPYELIENSKWKKIKGMNNGAEEQYLKYMLPSKDKDYSKVKLNKIRRMIKESGVDIPEIHVTEFNSSISHRNPANDTTFKAAFIVKNILDNLDEVNSFGYWFCSDISGELNDSKTVLYGDMGLISANGINKPGFYAYTMLAKLQDELIQKGEGYIITKKSSYSYGIITYNYKHFNYSYCLKGEEPVSLDKYYDIFEDKQNLRLTINLKGIKRGSYRVKKYILNRKHGSIFDELLSMNTANNIKKDEIDYLKQVCMPKQKVFYVEGIDELKLECYLSPHEVNFYEINFEYN